MNFQTIWLIGWVVTSLILIIGANAVTEWSNDDKSKFSLSTTLLGIVLWIPFLIILVGTIIGLCIKKRMAKK